MAKKKKSTKEAPQARAEQGAAAMTPPANPHATAGEKSDWGAKVSQPWTPPPQGEDRRKKNDRR